MFRHDHVALTVKDLQVSREFYEYLGGHVVSKPSPKFMEIVLGEIRLHLVRGGEGEGEGEASTTANDVASRIDHLCLRVGSVSDLAAIRNMLNAHPALRDRGKPCEVEESPPLGIGQDHVEEVPPQRTLYFEDPDGIRLEVRAYS